MVQAAEWTSNVQHAGHLQGIKDTTTLFLLSADAGLRQASDVLNRMLPEPLQQLLSVPGRTPWTMTRMILGEGRPPPKQALPAAKDSDSGSGPAHYLKLPEINSTVLQELGRANGVGPAVAKKLLTGEAPTTKRGVRAAVAQAKTDAGKVALKAAPPPKPPEVSKGLPKMKPGTKASFGPAKELSKAKYGYLPEQKKERDYLIGSATANDRMIEDLKALRAKHRSSGAGKMTRISALAQALHAEFKSLGERYHGAWDKARDYPSYMTLWQHIWSEEEGYELHKELEAVNNDLSDMMRHFWIAGRHLYTEDFEVLP